MKLIKNDSHINYRGKLVVSCTTPSPPHLVDMTYLYNTRLLVKLIKYDSHINYKGIMVVSCTTPSPPHLVDMTDLTTLDYL